VRLWRIEACPIGFEMGDGCDGRGRRGAKRRSTLRFSRRLALYKDALSFRRWGGVNLRGVDLLGNVGSFIFVVSIPFVFVFVLVFNIDLIFLFLFLIVFVVNGDSIRN
jgi:hypothetical protein